ncbi:MAG: nitroreductase family protein [Bacteroidales bacterium]
MKTEIKNAITNRRSYYTIGNQSTISDAEIEEILRFAIQHVPSAFDSQSARLLLLLGDQHKKLWEIVKSQLAKLVPETAFLSVEQKLNGFQAGYGTVLYFEDQKVITDLQKKYPSYADNFLIWSEHTSAMHQYVVWMLLEDTGLGASLQHYNPLIDEEVQQAWNLPQNWKLRAQMPFGKPTGQPAAKNLKPVGERLLVFK